MEQESLNQLQNPFLLTEIVMMEARTAAQSIGFGLRRLFIEYFSCVKSSGMKTGSMEEK